MKIVIKKENVLTKITLRYKEKVGEKAPMTTIKWEFTLGDSNADKLIKELVDMGYLQLSDERGYKYALDMEKDDFYKLYEKVFGKSLKS